MNVPRRPGLADRQALALWADFIISPSELERLVSRLILETTPESTHLGVKEVGKGTSTGNWDGTVTSAKASTWVPAGHSVWALSVKLKVGGTDDAYAAQLTTPDGTALSSSTYVAVTLRPWLKRNGWARERAKAKHWRKVIAYGLDDIDTWLQSAPVTWAWFSEQIGLDPPGLRTAEAWWEKWSSQVDSKATTDQFLDGRAKQVDELIAFLAEEPRITTISGTNAEEAAAFVAAAVMQHSQTDGHLLARTAFVDDDASWQALLEQPRPLVLVVMAKAIADHVPAESRHHIVVPSGPCEEPAIKIPSQKARKAVGARRPVKKKAKKQPEAGKRPARRTSAAKRRSPTVTPDSHHPPWSKAPVSRSVRAALLAGRWSDDVDGDQRALRDLSGMEYEVLRESIATMSSAEPPLVVSVAQSWHLASPADAWLLLRGALTSEDLDHLEETAILVLGEVGPPPEPKRRTRTKPGSAGKARTHSDDLRRGLARSLALLGLHGDAVACSDGGVTGTDRATNIVRQVLGNDSGGVRDQRWPSLWPVLPLLAEASPDAFLACVVSVLDGEPGLFQQILEEDSEATVPDPAPPTGVIGALEILAWSSEHFGSAVDALAGLDENETGDRYGSRAFGSLASIFRPEEPATMASPASRLAALDRLRHRHPRHAWQLMLVMLARTPRAGTPTSEPRFRDWKQSLTPPTDGEYESFIGQVVGRALADAGLDARRWTALLERSISLLPIERRRIVDALEVLAWDGQLSSEDGFVIWQSLREQVARQREFSSAEWALPVAEVDRLEQIMSRLTPTDAFLRTAWLFADDGPHLGNVALEISSAEYEAELTTLRKEAVVAVYDDGGIDAVRELAVNSSVPWAVGIAVADGLESKWETDVLDLLSEPRSWSDVTMAQSYLGRRFATSGWANIEPILLRTITVDPRKNSPGQSTADVTASAITDEVLEDVHVIGSRSKLGRTAGSLGSRVSRAFWKLFPSLGLGPDLEYSVYVAHHLTEVGRFNAALRVLLSHSDSTSSDITGLALFVAETLELRLASSAIDPDTNQLDEHDFQRLMAFMEEHKASVGESRLALLEWSYLPMLGSEPEIPTLHAALTSSPALFVDVVSEVCRPQSGHRGADSSPDPGDGVSKEPVALNGYQLLKSWRK